MADGEESSLTLQLVTAVTTIIVLVGQILMGVLKVYSQKQKRAKAPEKKERHQRVEEIHSNVRELKESGIISSRSGDEKSV